jgi:hypothetical protein
LYGKKKCPDPSNIYSDMRDARGEENSWNLKIKLIGCRFLVQGSAGDELHY